MHVLSLVVRRYAPFESFGGGYEGDNRGFSTDLKATARTIAVVEFWPGTSQPPQAYGRSSGSAWIGPWGVRKNPKVGPITGSIASEVGKVKVSLSDVHLDAQRVRFTMHSEGNMPMKDIAVGTKGYPNAGVATTGIAMSIGLVRAIPTQGTPDIDTILEFTASFGGGRASLSGTMYGDGFPNAEVLLVDAKGRVAPLLDYRTKSGFAGPFYRLFLAGKKNKVAEFSCQVPLTGGTLAAGTLPPPVVVQED